MRFTPRVSLLVALLCGLCAVLLARSLMTGGSEPGPSRTIVVARAPIPPGMPLTRENLREIRWHGTDALPGSFARVDDLVRDGRRLALASFQRDEPVLSGRVTAPNQRATLSTQLDDGMRAVAVRVDEIRGVAGFVLPGDRVDLVLTRGENGTGGDAKAYADLLLQNAKVLAVDQVAAEGQEKPTVARAVTLELTQMEAQKVVLAQGIGRLSLILRQAGEVGGDVPLRVTASDLGPDATAERDRLAELEKQLEAMRKASAEAELRDAQRLAEVEARMRRDLDKPVSAFARPPSPTPPKVTAPSSIVNVIRNGSKTEQYNVAAER